MILVPVEESSFPLHLLAAAIPPPAINVTELASPKDVLPHLLGEPPSPAPMLIRSSSNFVPDLPFSLMTASHHSFNVHFVVIREYSTKSVFICVKSTRLVCLFQIHRLGNHQ